MIMGKKSIIQKLIRNLERSKKKESHPEGSPSKAEIIATEYMRRIQEGQKRAASEDYCKLFETINK